MRYMKILGILMVLVVLLSGCANRAHTSIQLNQPDPTVLEKEKTSSVTPVRVAVSSMLSPKETMTNYEGLVDYLQAKLGKPVVLLQRKTYKEVNDLVQEGGADVAFVCSGGYVAGNISFGMELLVAPQINAKTQYQSYIITATQSEAKSLADLKGRSFAFTDPMSFSGRIAPLYMTTQLGYDGDAFFSRTFYTYSHDNAIKAVSDGLVDGAAVDSLVFESVIKDPAIAGKVKVIDRSFMVGTPPVVVSPMLDTALKQQIKAILLTMHDSKDGKNALEPLQIDRFVSVDDTSYAVLKNVWYGLRDKL